MTATVLEGRPGEVVIEAIDGDNGRLSKVAGENCAGIAAIETLKLLGDIGHGVSLKLNKVSSCTRPEPLSRVQLSLLPLAEIWTFA